MSELVTPFTGLGGRQPWKPLDQSWFEPGDGESKAAQMRKALREGPMTAAELTMAVGLKNSAFVSALLKGDLRCGRVRFKGGKYYLNGEFNEQERERVAEAIALLRRNGYQITRRCV